MPYYIETLYTYECDGCGAVSSSNFEDDIPEDWEYDDDTDVVNCDFCQGDTIDGYEDE